VRLACDAVVVLAASERDTGRAGWAVRRPISVLAQPARPASWRHRCSVLAVNGFCITTPFGLSLSKPPRALSLPKGLSLSKPPLRANGCFTRR